MFDDEGRVVSRKIRLWMKQGGGKRTELIESEIQQIETHDAFDKHYIDTKMILDLRRASLYTNRTHWITLAVDDGVRHALHRHLATWCAQQLTSSNSTEG